MNSEVGVKKWLEMINIYGLSFVKNTPVTLEATQALAERISFLRETLYGKLWGFQPDLQHKDMAYTNKALHVHTDTTYFSEPIGLQMLHLLKQTGEGGESILVDGFHVAKQFQSHYPKGYEILSQIPIPSQFRDSQHYYTPEPMPMLCHSKITGELYQIRYNNEDRNIMFQLRHSNGVELFYRYFRLFTQFIRHEAFEYQFQLEPGKPAMFDNWRILHGRKAFSGDRHIAGCYIGHDEWKSRLSSIRNKIPD
jgi:trimethyllysine dioxygenase